MNRDKRNRRTKIAAREGCRAASPVPTWQRGTGHPTWFATLIARLCRAKIETSHKWARVENPSLARALRSSGPAPF